MKLEFRHRMMVEGRYKQRFESGFPDLAFGDWRTPSEHLHGDPQPHCKDELVGLLRTVPGEARAHLLSPLA